MFKTFTYKTLIIIAIMSCSFFTYSQQNEVYIAINGNDNNTGSCDQPMASLKAAVDRSREIGAKTIWIRGGRYFFDDTTALGSQDSGLLISGFENETVIFDGGQTIASNSFSLVNDDLNGRIKNEVSGKLQVSTIRNSNHIAFLKSPDAGLAFNDRAISISRFPNEGYTRIEKTKVQTGFETVNQTGTNNAPKGPVFELDPFYNFNNTAWDAEINRNNKILSIGYTSAKWFKETIGVSNAAISGKRIRLKNGTRYGIENRNALMRTYFINILYELDEPGEWYFDDVDNKLYMYPPSVFNENSRITLWNGPQLITINNGSNITIERMKIQNIGGGNSGDAAINVSSASNNILIAGVVFINISGKVTSINFLDDVTNSTVKSCDFIDSNSIRLYGGSHTNSSIKVGGNTIENCHFTMAYRKDSLGKFCGIRGVGNTLKNNLVHNTNGQPITFSGIDHIIEKNEVFNVGVEEGDGGAMYTGNAVWSFGNMLKNNFMHHTLDYPGLGLGRATFFSDDNDSGESIIGNVVFRGGSAGFSSSGLGHTVKDNIFMRCFYGVRAFTVEGGRVQRSIDFYNDMMDYINNDPLNNNKANYLGRFLKETGVNSWQNGINENNWRSKVTPFWLTRYPLLEESLDAIYEDKSFRCFGNYITDNLFFMNRSKDVFANDAATLSNNRAINLSIFSDPNSLNFNYNGSQPTNAPNIPFNQIGLYKDGYRCDVPNKTVYRSEVYNHFKDRPGFFIDYNPNTVNRDVYFNSGLSVLSTIPCFNTNDDIDVTVFNCCTSPTPWYADNDNDDLGDPNETVSSCFQPGGYVNNANDECPEDNLNTCTIVHDIPGIIEAEEYFEQQGIMRENTTDIGGGMNIGFIRNGDYVEYKTTVTTQANFEVSFRVASDTEGGLINISTNGSSISTINVENTSGWQNWQTLTTAFNLPSGNQNIRLSFSGNAGFLFNINSIEFSDSTLSNNNYNTTNISFYPNPTNKSIFISGLLESRKFFITDLTGKILNNKTLQPNKINEIDVSQLQQGLYLLIEKSSNSSVYKFIKQ